MENILPWLPFRVQAVMHRIIFAITGEFIFFYGLLTEQARFSIFALVFLSFVVILEIFLEQDTTDEKISEK